MNSFEFRRIDLPCEEASGLIIETKDSWLFDIVMRIRICFCAPMRRLIDVIKNTEGVWIEARKSR